MPFTVSHAVAVLPLFRTPLIPSAMVIGAVAPDLLYFVPLAVQREFSHSLPGLLTLDLLVGLVAFAAWIWIVRRPLIDLSPAWLRQRARPQRDQRTRGLAATAGLVVASILIGSATHLVWDSFTHAGWLTETWPVLTTQVGPLPLFKWLQHGSSIAGLAILVVVARQWVRRTPRAVSDGEASGVMRTASWIAMAGVFGLAGLAVWLPGIPRVGAFDPSLVFFVARVSIGAVCGATAVVAIAWWWWRRP